MKVAVLGLGRMGQALGRRLLDGGHDLVVWNRSKGRAAGLVAAGAHEAGDVAEAAGTAEVVISVVSDDAAVRELALGDGGVRSAIGGGVYVDSSTVSPRLSAELAERFERFVAMPIVGAPEMVASGQATYLVGGGSDTVALLRPVLTSLSERVRHYGLAPTAAHAKLATNLLLLSGIAALAEAFAVGRAGGLSDDALRDLLDQSPVVAPAMRARFEGVLTGSGAAWWTTTLGAKDAGLAVDAAGDGDCRLRVAPAVRDAYLEAAAAGLAAEDITAVARIYGPQDSMTST